MKLCTLWTGECVKFRLENKKCWRWIAECVAVVSWDETKKRWLRRLYDGKWFAQGENIESANLNSCIEEGP